MRIEYADLCPQCSAENQRDEITGLINNLGYDTDEDAFTCKVGHVVPKLPSEMTPEKTPETGFSGAVIGDPVEAAALYDLEQQKMAEPSTTASQDNARLASILSALEGDGKAEINAETPLAQTGGVPEKRPAGSSALPSGDDLDRIDADRRAQAATAGVVVREGEAVELLGGDLLLGVRVTEQWRQAVEAEAAAQVKTPGAYFGEWLQSEEIKTAISDALANYWLANYTQTV
jgi:hypothetical protein